jgi:hypothetical protein
MSGDDEWIFNIIIYFLFEGENSPNLCANRRTLSSSKSDGHFLLQIGFIVWCSSRGMFSVHITSHNDCEEAGASGSSINPPPLIMIPSRQCFDHDHF